jgi:hypothetical protein
MQRDKYVSAPFHFHRGVQGVNVFRSAARPAGRHEVKRVDGSKPPVQSLRQAENFNMG